MTTNVTIAEIASLARVNPSTVSRVLGGNNQIVVSQACRARILKIARKLNYAPNHAGRSLVSGKSYTIVAVLGDMEGDLGSPFFIPVMAELTRTLWAKGYTLSLLPADARDRRTLNCNILRIIRESRADGYFIPNMFLSAATLALLRQRRRPVVTFAKRDGDADLGGIVNAVVLDERPGADGMAKTAAQMGHRRVLYITPAIRPRSPRMPAMWAALRRAGITFSKNDCLVYNQISRGFLHDRPNAYAAAMAHMDKLCAYSLLVCCSDLVAMGVMDALRERGLEPGRDISVAGYDNLEENVHFHVDKPRLATIDRCAHERGRAAAELLLERLEQPGLASVVRLVPTRFIQRMSMTKPNGRLL